MSTRVAAHKIDTRTINKFRSASPPHWVIHDQTERDYGIDLAIEFFEPQEGDSPAQSTGGLVLVQLKGVNGPAKPRRKGGVAVSVRKKFLKYAEKFANPFLLVHVDLSESGLIHFVWLQEYIRRFLSIEMADWRTSSSTTVTISLPAHNVLPERIAKVDRISRESTYLLQLVDYCQTLAEMGMDLDRLAASNDEIRPSIAQRIERLADLDVLMKHNSCCVGRSEMLAFADSIRNGEDYDIFNIGLLRDSLVTHSLVQELSKAA